MAIETLYTFDKVGTGLAAGVVMRPNDTLLLDTTIDYREICIPVNAFKRLVLELNDTDGINIVFLNGDKETIKPQFVSRVGVNTGSSSTDLGFMTVQNTFGTDSTALLTAFKTLLDWV